MNLPGDPHSAALRGHVKSPGYEQCHMNGASRIHAKRTLLIPVNHNCFTL